MTRTKGPWSWVLGAIWSMFAVIAVAILTEDRTPGGILVGGVVLALGTWCGARALLSRTRLDDAGLTYVGYARTHRVDWSQVRAVEVTPLDQTSVFRVLSVVVHLRDGSELGLAALAGFALGGRNRRLERFARECERLQALDPRP